MSNTSVYLDILDYFHSLEHFIKFKYFLDIAGINHSNFSRLMKSGDITLISFDKIQKLYYLITLELSKARVNSNF